MVFKGYAVKDDGGYEKLEDGGNIGDGLTQTLVQADTDTMTSPLIGDYPEDDLEVIKPDNQGGGQSSGQSGNRAMSYANAQDEPINTPPPMTDLLQGLSNSVGKSRSVIEDFFSRPKRGEVFLLTENFDKIKQDLNLSPNTTPLDLATLINQQLQ